MTKEIEDAWDFPPVPLRYLGPEFDGLSPEQIAARLEGDDRYGRRVAEWRRQRVAMVKTRIWWLRDCEEKPMRKRCNLRWGKYRRYIGRVTYVYLMLCPSRSPTIEPAEPSDSDGRRVYKIGHTHDLNMRTGCHRRSGLDSRIEHYTIYHTVVPRRRILERLLLDHYKPFRCRQDLGEELVSLAQEEADGFEAVAKAIEQHLLAVEYLRLDATLAWLKAECQ